jgi:hypothetical protein
MRTGKPGYSLAAHRSTAGLTDDKTIWLRHFPGVNACLWSSFLVLLSVMKLQERISI